MRKKIIKLLKQKEELLYLVSVEQRSESNIFVLRGLDKNEIELKAQIFVLISLLEN